MARVQRPRGPVDDQRIRPKQLSPQGEALYDLPLETTCDERTTSCAAISPTADDGGFSSADGFTLIPENDSDGLAHTGDASVEPSDRLQASPVFDGVALPDRGPCKNSLSVERGGGKKQSLLVPCLAVFSSNYNFTVTSIALYLMNQDPVYKEASANVVGNSTVKMLSYAGAIVGMCTMGYLGDLVGRRRAMVFTLFLVFVGALLSSACPWGSGVSVLVIMGVFRFILGVGSGGVYPLSAVSAAEGAGTDKSEDRSMRVSWTYSMNVPGIMAPYIVALILWSCTDDVNVCFRVLLAFGAIPALLIWLPAWRIKEDKNYIARDFAKHLVGVLWTRGYWRQLLGTGVCWLLYDVTAYGILLVQPEITQTIWGNRTSVTDIIWQNIVLNGMGIPGCYMGILVLRQMGVKWLQFWGFMGLAGSAFLMAATAGALEGVAWAQLLLLCIVNFFINWGASITTFILPSLVFPPEVRSTYSGISAALGKVGAVGGIYAMKAILSAGGLTPMMICAGIPSLVAAVLTWFYVDPMPSTLKSSCLQCFGSLAGSCPFVDCRRGKAACCGRAR